jgi:hypothetical protein
MHGLVKYQGKNPTERYRHLKTKDKNEKQITLRRRVKEGSKETEYG